MNNNPDGLYYTKTHEWLRPEGDQIYVVGVTSHAQNLLGDIVFVELPELDVDVSAGDEVAVIESVKTAADVYSPVSGRIVSNNELLTADPGIINRDPYGDGWLFQIRIENDEQLSQLLDAGAYEENVSE